MKNRQDVTIFTHKIKCIKFFSNMLKSTKLFNIYTVVGIYCILIKEQEATFIVPVIGITSSNTVGWV